MSLENYGKKQSDWWVPALVGGIAVASVPFLSQWITPAFDAWYGPDESVWRVLAVALTTGLIVAGVFHVLARLTKAWRRRS
jgi:tetrahydromethanopterin S-methyltransferase subunit C